FRHDNLRRTLPELFASGNLRLDAVYTHFASADDPESPLFDQQRQNYDAALRVVDDLLCHYSPAESSVARTLSGPRGDRGGVGRGLSASPGGPDKARPTDDVRLASDVRPYLRHAANSAATLRDSRVWYDTVRPGLLLYGIV